MKRANHPPRHVRFGFCLCATIVSRHGGGGEDGSAPLVGVGHRLRRDARGGGRGNVGKSGGHGTHARLRGAHLVRARDDLRAVSRVDEDGVAVPALSLDVESKRGGRAWSLGEIEDGEAFPGFREGGADEDEPAEVGVALFSEGEVVRLVHAGGRRAEAHASGVGVPGDVEGAFALQPAKAEDQRVRVRLDRHLHLGGDRQLVDLAHGSDQRGVVEGGEFAVERVPGDGSRGGGAGDGGTRRHREPRDRRARARGGEREANDPRRRASRPKHGLRGGPSTGRERTHRENGAREPDERG